MMTTMEHHDNPNYPRVTDEDRAMGPVHCRYCGVRILVCQCDREPRHWVGWAYGKTYCTGHLERGHEPPTWRRVELTDEEAAAMQAEGDYWVAKQQAQEERRALADEVTRPFRRLLDWLTRRVA